MSRPNKYRAKKAQCVHGHTHDSQREARRCCELHNLQRIGSISMLQIHPQFWFVIDGKQLKHPNGRRVGFKADFSYVELPGLRDVVEDSKGFRTPDYVLRAAFFRALFPDLELREV